MNDGLLRALGLPDQFGQILLLAGLVLCLAPYVHGVDFGAFKIPSFEPAVRSRLKVLGPVWLLLAVLAHVPTFPRHTVPTSSHGGVVTTAQSESGKDTPAERQPEVGPPDPSKAAVAPNPTASEGDADVTSALAASVAADPKNVLARVQLANHYFDVERYSDAAPLYAEALRLSPNDVAVSTDLAVCYYYLNSVDQALNQLEYSLALDPRNSKTLLNKGVVLAFGKKDIPGAASAFRSVLDAAPNSPEAKLAKQALASMK